MSEVKRKSSFFRGKAGASASENDVESLLTLHGILCAFLVSISLGIELGVAPAAMDRANFYGAMAKEQNFREWVVQVIDKKNNQTSCGCSEPEGFDWNIDVAPGVTIDVKYELLHGLKARLPACDMNSCSLNGDTNNPHYADQKLSLVVSVLFPEMDMRFMETWFLQNPKGCAPPAVSNQLQMHTFVRPRHHADGVMRPHAQTAPAFGVRGTLQQALLSTLRASSPTLRSTSAGC